MQVVSCSKCRTRFEITNKEFIDVSDRVLKCSNCGHMWLGFEVLEKNKKLDYRQETINLESKSLEESTTLMLKNIVGPRKRYIGGGGYSINIILKIILFVLLFLNLISFIILKSNSIAKNLPFLSFLVFKLSDSRSFIIIDPKIKSISKNNPLFFSFYILNNGNVDLFIPDVRIQFLDKNNMVIKSIVHKLPKKLLKTNEKSLVSNRMVSYPKNANKISIEIGNHSNFMFK